MDIDLSDTLIALLFFCDVSDEKQVMGINMIDLMSDITVPPTTVCHKSSNLRLVIAIEKACKVDSLINLAEESYLEVFQTPSDLKLDVLLTMINSLFIYSNMGSNILDISDSYVFKIIFDMFDMFCEFMDSLEHDEFEHHKLQWAQVCS
jgi:hypothetical protein